MSLITKIFDIIAPIIYGVALAYLLSPILNFFEKKVFRFKSQKKGIRNLRRILSLVCTILVVMLLIAAAISVFIPQIIDSYNRLKNGLPGYIASFESFRNDLDEYLEDLFSRNELLTQIYEGIKNFLGVDENNTLVTQLLNKVVTFLVGLFSAENLAKLFSMGTSVISVIIDMVLAAIFCIYILLSKDKQLARIRKLFAAFFKESTVKEVYRIAYLADDKIGRYLRVQVFDSILVGIASYVVYMLFDLPFYPMLALISGLTNIIPYFGPFIGGIPNGIVVFLAEPDKLLPFILIVVIMQQLDGNVLVPILQSNNMKMDTLWVLVGMTVMGGIFGLPGMIIGVPTFSVIYILVKEQAEKRLAAKNLSPDTAHYMDSLRPPKQKKKLRSSLPGILQSRRKKGNRPAEDLPVAGSGSSQEAGTPCPEKSEQKAQAGNPSQTNEPSQNEPSATHEETPDTAATEGTSEMIGILGTKKEPETMQASETAKAPKTTEASKGAKTPKTTNVPEATKTSAAQSKKAPVKQNKKVDPSKAAEKHKKTSSKNSKR